MATATYSVTIGAGGTGTVTIQTRSVVPWVVGQVTNELQGAPSGATCNLRKNGALISPLIAPSDVAAGEPFIELLGTDSLTVEWAGCTPGTIGKVVVLYTEKP
jgi:hypothetical protein